MSKYRVPTRKIKHDEFVSTVSRMVLYLEENSKRVLVYALVGGVLLAAGIGTGNYLRRRSRQASSLLGAALTQYRNADQDSFSAGGPGSGGFSSALDRFQEVINHHPRSGSARIASFYSGLCMVRLGRRDEAYELFERFLDRNPRAYHASQARLALARLAEERGERDRALELYREVADQGSPGLTQPEGLLELGRYLELIGQPEQAVRIYDRIQKEFAGTEFFSLALQRSSNLGEGTTIQ